MEWGEVVGERVIELNVAKVGGIGERSRFSSGLAGLVSAANKGVGIGCCCA